MEQERQEIIDCLKQHASEVKKLKETHRKRRPIVIEFSGSPKAGKTSCINSLRQFLKRNGFEVEIIQERASVCPVSDKRSPMFNVWTSYAYIDVDSATFSYCSIKGYVRSLIEFLLV